MAQAGLTFTGDHNGKFQIATSEGEGLTGISVADPDRRIYEYDSRKELLAWPVAMAMTAWAIVPTAAPPP